MKDPALRACAALLAAVMAGSGMAAGVADGDVEAMRELFQERYDWEMRERPEIAMRRGDYRRAAHVTDNSLAAIGRRHRETVDFHERLKALGPSGLTENDLVDYELFELELEREIEDYRFRKFLMPIGQREGLHQDIPQAAEGIRFAAYEDYENYLGRLEQTPALVDNAIALMRLGLEEGRTPPRVAIAGVPAQLDALLAEGGLDALLVPLASLPPRLTEAQRQTLPARMQYDVMPTVRKALERLRTFVRDEYFPGARESIAATDFPNGDALYAHELWTMTTTRMSAREIHELGLREVARIRAEMMDVIRRSDYLELHPDEADLEDAQLFDAFIGYLRADARFYYDDPEALLTGYRDICKRVDAHLPRFFRTLPRLPYGVKAIPGFMAPYQTTAYYDFGSIENAEPGWFYANTYALDQRPRYEMIALAMHEAVPGHHLQTAIAQELENVPEFRRYAWFTAFGEGWALYSERLGIEMGLYEDPYDDFGRLLYEMWRACRLVVDPGIHAMGWSRERAIRYMLDNTALSELNITNEVDRYIAWPGQACGYKIGELRIRALREQAEARLGESFDLRAFHDVVLGAGSVPLTVLDRRVWAWVRRQPAGAAYD